MTIEIKTSGNSYIKLSYVHVLTVIQVFTSENFQYNRLQYNININMYTN